MSDAPTFQIDPAALRRLVADLVAIDSVPPGEARLAAYVAEHLRGLGVEPEWHAVEPGRPNVYARAEFGSDGPFLVFSGHSDTVGAAAGWETPPFTLTEQGGRLYGLGVYNMKSGIACMLAAFGALVAHGGRLGLRGRLGFALTVDQEGGSAGARALLATPFGRCDAMLHGEHFYGDSPETYLPSAGLGKVLYRLVVRGRAAHGFRPHLGINAVDDAARIVTALDRLPLRNHPDFGRGTVCTLKIDGGYRQYEVVVPERCEVIVNRLLVPGETREQVLADMRGLVDGLGLRSTVEIELTPPAFEPYALDPATPLMPAFVAAYRAVLGSEPYFAPHRGITDANVYVAAGGIPTICLGPKGGRHHSPGEYVEAATLEPVARIYIETARRYLAHVKPHPA